MRCAGLLVLVCGTWLSGHAFADDVHLVGGSTIQGKVTRHGDKISVETESGQISFAADAVERIERRESSVQQFEHRYAALAANDVAGRLALADYCRDHELRAYEHKLLREVLEHDKDNAQARARLGYVKSDTGWITREQQQRARGLVQHEGAWITRSELLQIETARTQAETAARERDKARTELEAKQIELERQRLELETARAKAATATTPPAPAAVYVTPAFGWGYRDNPAANGCGWRERCNPTPSFSNPHPYPLNGFRDPRDNSWALPGFKDPRSYR